MNPPADTHQSPGERTENVEKIQKALGQAVRKALLSHKQAGNPVAVWRDGRVVWVKPEDIPVLKAQ